MEKDQNIKPSYFNRPQSWGKRLRFPFPRIITENLHVCDIGHAFGQLLPPLSNIADHYVTDFLVDQSQSTGGGAAMEFDVHFDLTNARGYRYIIKPGCRKSFKLTMPSGINRVDFSIALGRQDITQSGFFDAITANVQFVNLVGTAPVLDYNTFFIQDGYNGALLFEIEGHFTGPATFDRIELLGEYSPRSFDPGTKWYKPLSYAVPFGTQDIYPESETFALFSYQTNNNVDPGKMITMI